MTFDEVRQFLRGLPPDQLEELLAEFIPQFASDTEVTQTADKLFQRFTPALRRLKDR